LTPVFLEVEYRMPGFPQDDYGFTFSERLHWSRLALDYLVNDEDISFLGELHFPDGSPLYNERELRHMVDVKLVVQQMLTAWRLLTPLLIITGIWAQTRGWRRNYWQAVMRGGWLTVGLIAAILLSVAVSFNALFTFFHRIFFEGDTWIFLWSDTLIRLFPLRLWQDAFIYVGGFSLALAALCIALGRKLSIQNNYPLSLPGRGLG
ncbi:MAG: DUF1461 domain-containing protein, partial [Anaerolineaceae bacterium]|nr:DUF1461 domain-containing protein [Anaerolineaceae bacterium]